MSIIYNKIRDQRQWIMTNDQFPPSVINLLIKNTTAPHQCNMIFFLWLVTLVEQNAANPAVPGTWDSWARDPDFGSSRIQARMYTWHVTRSQKYTQQRLAYNVVNDFLCKATVLLQQIVTPSFGESGLMEMKCSKRVTSVIYLFHDGMLKNKHIEVTGM